MHAPAGKVARLLEDAEDELLAYMRFPREHHDFHVTVDGQELPAVSCYLRQGERILHTYTTTGRGTEYLASASLFLDLTALGRQENWEQPKGRVSNPYLPDPSFTA